MLRKAFGRFVDIVLKGISQRGKGLSDNCHHYTKGFIPSKSCFMLTVKHITLNAVTITEQAVWSS